MRISDWSSDVCSSDLKREAHPKIEVWRADTGKPMLQPDDPQIIAVASDAPIDGLPVPLLDAGDVTGIAAFIPRWLAEGDAAATAAPGTRRGAAGYRLLTPRRGSRRVRCGARLPAYPPPPRRR